MRIRCRTRSHSALTLVEVLVAIVIVLLAILFLLPLLANSNPRSPRIYCVNNLKQVGLSFAIWANDHGNMYPMQLSETNGGTSQFTSGSNAFRHFQVMSNQLSTPKTVYCPAESDSWRKRAATFGESISNKFIPFKNNTNLSYFVGVDANQTKVNMILSGDHNITNSLSPMNDIMTLTTNRPAGWTEKFHHRVGNVTMADGSVQQVSTLGLRQIVENSGLATNRLQMP